jgi:hypothetical protein
LSHEIKRFGSSVAIVLSAIEVCITSSALKEIVWEKQGPRFGGSRSKKCGSTVGAALALNFPASPIIAAGGFAENRRLLEIPRSSKPLVHRFAMLQQNLTINFRGNLDKFYYNLTVLSGSRICADSGTFSAGWSQSRY